MVQGSGCAPVPLVPQQPIGTCLWASVQSAGFLPLYGEGIIVCRSGCITNQSGTTGAVSPRLCRFFDGDGFFLSRQGKLCRAAQS